MKRLNLNNPKSKTLFEEYFGYRDHFLSSHSFINLFIWQDFFEFYYEILSNQLCIFAKSNLGTFLYLPPLGRNFDNQVTKEVFNIMNSCNENREVSRIENIEQQHLPIYKKLGYKIYLKSKDYLHKVDDLINLRGNRFKSKRSLYNYLIKNYNVQFLEYKREDYKDCLHLFKVWQHSRLKKYNDDIYKAMLEQSGLAFKCMLKNLRFLRIASCTVKVDNKIKACSFGYKLNKETFCIIFEIADSKIKGISQFIFREFCRQQNNFRYINVMDDSGLDNLKQTKLSYRPVRLVESYCVKKSVEQ